ncbi:hypothetical protein CLOLEP_00347 [[Clostridium] leptum DSM 753]|uniref:Uncharacterized protein n=1 Tax=[Clostridium] leptum DSM 753 TaxID=428125 RepID=A7VP71_9FIRM|nr:hypothetical protein CLOLEP_00347 [[Clostridium] leptum DSM 753]
MIAHYGQAGFFYTLFQRVSFYSFPCCQFFERPRSKKLFLSRKASISV